MTKKIARSTEKKSNQVQAPAGVDESNAPQAPAPSVVGFNFADIMARITDEERNLGAHAIGKAFDEREAYELVKNPATKITTSLKASRGKMIQHTAVAALLAAGANESFVNRSISEGKRYNVYGLDKVQDLAHALAGAPMRNAINNAICRSLFAFRAAGVDFTAEASLAAASAQIRVDPKLQKILVRHTVSPGTASTQASSTLSALQTLGIVENRGTRRAAVYALTDTPQTHRLEQLLAA